MSKSTVKPVRSSFLRRRSRTVRIHTIRLYHDFGKRWNYFLQCWLSGQYTVQMGFWRERSLCDRHIFELERSHSITKARIRIQHLRCMIYFHNFQYPQSIHLFSLSACLQVSINISSLSMENGDFLQMTTNLSMKMEISTISLTQPTRNLQKTHISENPINALSHPSSNESEKWFHLSMNISISSQ